MTTFERPPDMTAQQYGSAVHKQFSDLVRLSDFEGMAREDVETTFPDGPYGSPDSIRTDVVLRDQRGRIIAIYDVKTGESGLSEARANQLRVKTNADLSTAVIELRFNRSILKVALLSVDL
jgi:hypothetical protein